LKKYAAHFFNHAVGVTGEKEAANPVTGVSSTTCAKVRGTRNLQMARIICNMVKSLLTCLVGIWTISMVILFRLSRIDFYETNY